ncbi:SepM family pheromone-processing serine protease [Enterococcus sp. 5H]|uniref:SepM family pheromone-processing serine protease n=1 Tax=Enterococcus sp. 5H TaxID=1229490 RepID=UPI0023020C36|nr:SepM family pheromone-processing serine protease [Enterococcus sp. 5H]MDA9472017.1 Lon-like protease with PDZ [Enterococcus sp. 5H]
MKKKKIAIIVLSIIMVSIFFFWRTPLLIRGPGTIIGLENSVAVNEQKDQQAGAFFVTTVQTRSATIAEMVATLNDPFREIVNQETANDGLPTNVSRLIQRNSMNTSQNIAKKVGLDLADKEASIQYQGAFVLMVSKNSPFYKKLMPGDIVLAIDQQPVEESQEISAYLQKQQPNSKVTLVIQRQGSKQNVTGEVIYNESTEMNSLGIQFMDQTRLISDVPVAIDLGAVGGPSAGLMFTLQVYTLASENNLRAGRNIAGTGAVTLTGAVTRVGGIAEKVYAADQAGVDAFLVPDDELSEELRKNFPDIQTNYQEALDAAEKLNTDMEIVPIKNVQDAIDWLKAK